VPFRSIPSRKQRQMEKMTLQILRSIEVLGFTLEHLDFVEKNVVLDVDDDGFSHLGERQGRDKKMSREMATLEKLRRGSRTLTAKLRRTSVFESARRTSVLLESVTALKYASRKQNHDQTTVPTSNDLRLLMETLSMNVHDTWAKRKKHSGWTYGRLATRDDVSGAGGHSDKLRSTDSHTPTKFDERLVPFDYLLGPYKARCSIMVQTIVETISSRGGQLLKKDTGLNTLASVRQQLRSSVEDSVSEQNIPATIDDVRQLMLDNLLQRAVQENNVDAVRNLLTTAPGEEICASVDAKDAKKRTIVHKVVIHGHVRSLQELLLVGADAGARDKHGITPLMLAAFLGHGKVVDVLLREGANTIARDNHGWAAIHFAAYSNHANVIVHLARDLIGPGRPGIDFAQGSTPDWLAIAMNHSSSSRLGKKRKKTFLTPLSLAVQRLSLEAVEALIEQGADPTLTDQTGVSPYDRALLMADELSMRVEALDEKISAMQTMILGFSAKRTAVGWLKNCLSHIHCCKNKNASHSMMLWRGAHIAQMNMLLFAARKDHKGLLKKAKFSRATFAQFGQHEKDMSKLTRLRASLLDRYETVRKVLNFQIRSRTVKKLRHRFAFMAFLKKVSVLSVILVFVCFFSPMNFTNDYRMTDVRSGIGYMEDRISVANRNTRKPTLSNWLGAQRQLFGDAAGVVIGSNTSTTIRPAFRPLNAAGSDSTPTIGVAGGLRICAFERKSVIPAPTFLWWAYGESQDNDYIRGKASSNHTFYISLESAKSMEDGFRNVEDALSGQIGRQIRKVETTTSLYSPQLKVLLNVHLTLSYEPTGKVRSASDVSGCLLPLFADWSGWTGWSDRFAPSKTFQASYGFLFFVRIGQVFANFKRSREAFLQWIQGHYASIGRELLTLIILSHDMATALPLRNKIMASLLTANASTFVDSSGDYISNVSFMHDLFGLQILLIFVPLVLSLRLIPSFGPNLVAVFGAMINRTVLIYLGTISLLMFMFSCTFVILFSADSEDFGTVLQAFSQLFRLSFAEEFDNIYRVDDDRPRGATWIYNFIYLITLLLLLSIFIGIVSETYLKALGKSLEKWETLITSRMERDRRSNRKLKAAPAARDHRARHTYSRCGGKIAAPMECCGKRCGKIFRGGAELGNFQGNLWTSAMQNILIQARVLGKDAARGAKKTEGGKNTNNKLHKLIGSSMHLDLSTVKRGGTGGTGAGAISRDAPLRQLEKSNGILDGHTKKLMQAQESVEDLFEILSLGENKTASAIHHRHPGLHLGPQPPNAPPPSSVRKPVSLRLSSRLRNSRSSTKLQERFRKQNQKRSSTMDLFEVDEDEDDDDDDDDDENQK
jgi:ankyrin repeat protein